MEGMIGFHVTKGMKQMARFRTNLRKLMLNYSAERGKILTQEELAKTTGLSVPTISRWVNNNVSRLELDTIEALCSFFSVTMYELIEYDPNGEPPAAPVGSTQEDVK